MTFKDITQMETNLLVADEWKKKIKHMQSKFICILNLEMYIILHFEIHVTVNKVQLVSFIVLLLYNFVFNWSLSGLILVYFEYFYMQYVQFLDIVI